MGLQDPYQYEKSYDLVNYYDWTSVAPNSEMRNEAPAAYVTAYQLQFSQLRSFIDGYLNILSPTHFGHINKRGAKSATPGLDFYRRLYGTSSDPLSRFSFPFFSDNIRSFTTEFADTFSPVSQRGAKMLGGEFLTGLGGAAESVVGGGAALASSIANIGKANTGNTGEKSLIDKVMKTGVEASNSIFSKVLGKDVNLNPGMQTIGAPGSYIETPKFYQYSNTDNGLELSFALSNTLNDYGKEQNHKFITDFTRMNRPYRTGAIGMTFPAIYNIVIPGQRYIMWAYLENFSVGLLGMRRRIKLANGGSRVVPEAYSCQFTFRSLTIEAANFMDEIDKFGSFAGGGKDSYIALKQAEEQSLEGQKEVLNRAAMVRSERIDSIDDIQSQQVTGPVIFPGTTKPSDAQFALSKRFRAGGLAAIAPGGGYSTTTSVGPTKRRQLEAADMAVRNWELEQAAKGKGPMAKKINQILGIEPKPTGPTEEEQRRLLDYLDSLNSNTNNPE